MPSEGPRRTGPEAEPVELSVPTGSGSPARKIGLACAVELAFRHLALDVVFIAEASDAGDVYPEAAGDFASFGIELNEYGAAAPCYRALGEACSTTELADLHGRQHGDVLSALHGTEVGACIAVPLRLADRSPFGVLCGLSRVPRPGLDARDAEFMETLGEVIVPELADYRDQAPESAKPLTHRVATEPRRVVDERGRPYRREDFTTSHAIHANTATRATSTNSSRAVRMMPSLSGEASMR